MSRQFEFVLHIGTEKTGSTTLQHTLHRNQSTLAEKGLYYLATPGRVEARALAAGCLEDQSSDDYLRYKGIDTPEQRRSFRQTQRTQLHQMLAELPDSVQRVVISSEHFHSRLRKPSEVKRLHDWLAPFARKFQVVCYLRRQVDLAASYYSTLLKNGGSVSLQEAATRLCRPDNHYTNYQRLLSLWSDVFGVQAITVRRFDRTFLHRGSIIDDFLQILQIDTQALSDLSTDSKYNESLTPIGQALLRQINRLAKNHPQLVQQSNWQQSRAALFKAFAGRGQQLPRALAEQLQQSFDTGNEAVRQCWFPDQETLFSQTFDDAGEDIISVDQDQALGDLLDTIIDARSHINELPEQSLNVFPELSVQVESLDESQTKPMSALATTWQRDARIQVVYEPLDWNCPEVKNWCLDFPSRQQILVVSANGLGVMFQGWLLTTSEELSAQPYVRVADKIYRFSLDQARTDVIQKILGAAPRGHAQLYCGFNQTLSVTHDCVIFGIRINELEVDLLRIKFIVQY